MRMPRQGRRGSVGKGARGRRLVALVTGRGISQAHRGRVRREDGAGVRTIQDTVQANDPGAYLAVRTVDRVVSAGDRVADGRAGSAVAVSSDLGGYRG